MNSTNRNRGFSLIEVAIGILIIGIIMGPMITAYSIYLKQHALDVSRNNTGAARVALQRYVTHYGCYPLPGNPGVTSTNATFGQEAVARTAGSCTALAAAPPNCTGNDTVVCKTPGAGGNPVYIGDVPFAMLGLPHEYILDGYGSKLTYAVSGPLTVAATFTDAGGIITVHDSTGANTALSNDPATQTTSNIHFAVISHGQNKVGSFSLDGVLQANCGAVAAAADNENCNNDATFTDNRGWNGPIGGANTIYTRLEADAPGAAHYDDFIYWTVSTNTDLWIRQVNSSNILSNIQGNVRMGLTGALPPLAKADVRGDAKADALWTDNLCDNTAGCAAWGSTVGLVKPLAPGQFSPAIIGGTPAAADAQKPGGGIDCTGSAMIGIANSDEICTGNIKIPAGLINTALCPAGQGGCQVHPGAVGSMGCRVPGGPCI